MKRRMTSLRLPMASPLACALSLALVASACGGQAATSPAPKTTPTPKARLAAATSNGGAAPGRPALTRHAKLVYEVRGRAFPLPVVTGTIAGQPVTMLVDTGANSHIIAGWFAKKFNLPMKKLGEGGTDHVGKTIATYRIEKPDMAIDGWGALANGPVIATDVPDVIEKLGIGAFISPQRLLEEGDSVVLDLAGGAIHSAYWDDAQYELSAAGTPFIGAEEARACDEADGPIRVLAFVVPATVESQKVSLLVDTGAQHSDVFTSSAAGQRLASQSIVNKEPMYTASGKISARKLRGAKVAAGSHVVTTDVDLIGGSSDTSCPRDGVLAMDFLRTCTLLLGQKRLYGRCAPPGTTTTPSTPASAPDAR